MQTIEEVSVNIFPSFARWGWKYNGICVFPGVHSKASSGIRMRGILVAIARTDAINNILAYLRDLGKGILSCEA